MKTSKDKTLARNLKTAITEAKQMAADLYNCEDQLLAEHAYNFIVSLGDLELRAARILTAIDCMEEKNRAA